MKKYLLTAFLIALTALLANAQTIPTAGSGSGAFRVQVSDPFGSPSYNAGSVNFNASFGWPNSDPGGSPWVFNQIVQFDLTGNEPALNTASSIALELNLINNLSGVTSASLWFAAVSDVDVTGPDGGDGLMATAALPDQGTLIQGNISQSGTFTFDVTSVLKDLDYSTAKHVYFRLQVDGPTTWPGAGLLGTADLTASTLKVVAADVIPTAGSGSGAFRVQISDPFGTPSFNDSSANFSSSFGWPNSDPGGSPWMFKQIVQFDVTGMEATLNGADSIVLNLNEVNSLGLTTSASLWLAAQSDVDVTAQGNGGGNGLLATAALPGVGQLVGDVTAAGRFDFDLTWILKHLDYSTFKHLYFRLQVDAPTSWPGAGALGIADLTNSTLEIVSPVVAGPSGPIGAVKIVPSGSNVNLTFKVQQSTDFTSVPFSDVAPADITVTENAFGEVDINVDVGSPAPAAVFFRIAPGQ